MSWFGRKPVPIPINTAFNYEEELRERAGIGGVDGYNLPDNRWWLENPNVGPNVNRNNRAASAGNILARQRSQPPKPMITANPLSNLYKEVAALRAEYEALQTEEREHILLFRQLTDCNTRRKAQNNPEKPKPKPKRGWFGQWGGSAAEEEEAQLKGEKQYLTNKLSEIKLRLYNMGRPIEETRQLLAACEAEVERVKDVEAGFAKELKTAQNAQKAQDVQPKKRSSFWFWGGSRTRRVRRKHSLQPGRKVKSSKSRRRLRGHL
jgi:hypothetical protein